MSAATLPLPVQLARLLVIDAHGWHDRSIEDLPDLLGPNDLVVVNDAGTLPASLPSAQGEVRLAGPIEEGWIVRFGPGSWRDRTEDRAAPVPTDVVDIAGVPHPVLEVSPISDRLVRVALDPDLVWAHGRPIQYSYLQRDVALHEVQTPYAQRPWAVEMPSAGRPLTRALRHRLPKVVSLTHAAGLSATGEEALDRALPLRERFEVPDATWRAVQEADRVVAIGTSVVRALESHARGYRGYTDLRIEPDTELRVVDGLLSGMHEPGEPHFQMLAAFANLDRLRQAHAHAVAQGYRNHEFGDSTFLWRQP